MYSFKKKKVVKKKRIWLSPFQLIKLIKSPIKPKYPTHFYKLPNKFTFPPNNKNLLVLIALIVEHRERDTEENKKRIENINHKPQSLHRESQIASPIVKRVFTRLAIGNIRRKHQYRNCGNG